MKKFFYWLTMAALIAFIVASLGGCGGSHSNPGRSSESEEEKNTELSFTGKLNGDLLSIYGSEKYDKMMEELKAKGLLDNMNPTKMIICITDEEAEQLITEILAEAESDSEIDEDALRYVLNSYMFDAEKVKESYEQEETILLAYPDESFINKTLEAVGLERSYVRNAEENPSGRLEIYAIAKRTIGERTHTFTYSAACDENIATSNDEEEELSVTRGSSAEISGNKFFLYDAEGNVILSDDVGTVASADKLEVSGNPDEDGTLFTVERWRAFYEWCASLTDWAKEQEVTATAIEVRAAADDDLTKISEAQSKTFEFPGNRDNYSPWEGNEKKVNLRRRNTLNFNVYTCHSFRYGNDYYLVLASGTTIPQNFQDRTFRWYWPDGNSDILNYLSGYTGSFGFETYLMNSNWNSDLTVDDVALERHVPRNVNKSTTHNEGMSWNLGGEVGVNKDGPSAKISAGVSFNSSKSWVTTEYEIQDKTMQDKSASAEWRADVTGPSQGSYHARWTGGHWGVNATAASTNNLTFDTQWVWRVSKSVWNKFSSGSIPMRIICKWEEGFCHGKGFSTTPPYHWDDTRSYPEFSGTDTMYLDMPSHCWIGTTGFDFGGGGNKGNGGFDLLSEGDWMITNIPDWIHFNTTSGTATGDSPQTVRFEVDENPGDQRDAYMTFTMTAGSRVETKTIRVHQSSK